MSEIVFALVVLLLSVGSTYFFCVRRMRRGACAMNGSAQGQACQQDAESEVARLKREIAALRD
jgi:hypothetical protein